MLKNKLAFAISVAISILIFSANVGAKDKSTISVQGAQGASPISVQGTRKDSTTATPLAEGINMVPIKGRITTETNLNNTQNSRITAIHAELDAPFDIPPASGTTDTAMPCVVLSVVNPVPYSDPSGKLNSNCQCSNGGTFPVCPGPIVCPAPQVQNAVTGVCEAPKGCNSIVEEKTWGVACKGMTQLKNLAAHGTSMVIINTNPLYTAESKMTLVCNGATGSFDLDSSVCDLKPVGCTSNGQLSWGAGCTDNVGATSKTPGGKMTGTNKAAGYTLTSTASFTCNATGTFELDPGSVCDPVVATTCEMTAGTATWLTNCKGDKIAGTYQVGDPVTIANKEPGFTGSANYLCKSNGDFEITSTCVPETVTGCVVPADIVKSLCSDGVSLDYRYEQEGYCDAAGNQAWGIKQYYGSESDCPAIGSGGATPTDPGAKPTPETVKCQVTTNWSMSDGNCSAIQPPVTKFANEILWTDNQAAGYTGKFKHVCGEDGKFKYEGITCVGTAPKCPETIANNYPWGAGACQANLNVGKKDIGFEYALNNEKAGATGQRVWVCEDKGDGTADWKLTKDECVAATLTCMYHYNLIIKPSEAEFVAQCGSSVSGSILLSFQSIPLGTNMCVYNLCSAWYSGDTLINAMCNPSNWAGRCNGH